VKPQIWIAVSVYVLVAIVKKRLNLDASLYTFEERCILPRPAPRSARRSHGARARHVCRIFLRFDAALGA
jgi:hypothetical protein